MDQDERIKKLERHLAACEIVIAHLLAAASEQTRTGLRDDVAAFPMATETVERLLVEADMVARDRGWGRPGTGAEQPA